MTTLLQHLLLPFARGIPGQFATESHGQFLRNIQSDISATARKLAVIIWNMIIKKQPYNNEHDYEFLDQKRKRKVKEMKKLIHKFGLKTNELGLAHQ